MGQVKKAMKKAPSFDGISLDSTIYLEWFQTVKHHFKAKGCSGEESFMMATQKVQGPLHCLFKCFRKERPLQSKHKINTRSWLKSYMDVRFYRDQLFKKNPWGRTPFSPFLLKKRLKFKNKWREQEELLRLKTWKSLYKLLMMKKQSQTQHWLGAPLKLLQRMEMLFHYFLKQPVRNMLKKKILDEGIKEIITYHPLIPHQGPLFLSNLRWLIILKDLACLVMSPLWFSTT